MSEESKKRGFEAGEDFHRDITKEIFNIIMEDENISNSLSLNFFNSQFL